MEEGEISIVLVYMSHDEGEMSHSLYAIEMPNTSDHDHHRHDEDQPGPTPTVVKCSTDKPLKWSLILQFQASEFPYDMACAKLSDGRLYFFGGMLDTAGDNRLLFPDLDQFPRGVHAFNPSTGELTKEDVAMMNTGKSWPLSFVADDKLYVLGRHILTKEDSSSTSPTYFEVFDKKQWTALKPPPRFAIWKACSVVGRKVLVLGRAVQLFCFVFDLDTLKWDDQIITIPREVENLPLWTSSSSWLYPAAEEGSSRKKNAAPALYYGVRSDGVPCKSFITEAQTQKKVHELLTRHHWNQIDDDAAAGIGIRTRKSEYPLLSMTLCYLGDGRFFYLAVASPFPSYFAADMDECNDQFIQTVLFKDITPLGDDPDEAQPSSSATQAFKAECILSAFDQKDPSLGHIWKIKNSFAFRLTRQQFNRLTARAAEGGAAGSLKCEQMIREAEIQAHHSKADTLKEMEVTLKKFREIVENVKPDDRVQAVKEFEEIVNRYAVRTR
ncbi:hypothetical protein Tsubulata_007326 [Turnera subulata]|uniref:Uncharacterized protein n=1 Tax=Turnera subulata TaxID=218843 RepID=A0A9Q0FPA4_9ROSI|nr:hypothetical protein Tsubulata_007326 [Turnera subulata]